MRMEDGKALEPGAPGYVPRKVLVTEKVGRFPVEVMGNTKGGRSNPFLGRTTWVMTFIMYWVNRVCWSYF